MVGGLGLDRRQRCLYTFTMQPTAIYKPANLNPAYQLRFSWTGFPARGTPFPANVSLAGMDELQVKFWEHNYYVGTFGEYTMHAVRS